MDADTVVWQESPHGVHRRNWLSLMAIIAALITTIIAVPTIVLEESRTSLSIVSTGAFLVVLLFLVAAFIMVYMCLKQILMHQTISMTTQLIRSLRGEIPLSSISRIVCGKERLEIYWIGRGKERLEAIWLLSENQQAFLDSIRILRPNLRIEFK